MGYFGTLESQKNRWRLPPVSIIDKEKITQLRVENLRAQ
tara:strand:- start:374 stop:490 length:117 start_codon:yes stop_codon:yes gene_type:complete